MMDGLATCINTNKIREKSTSSLTVDMSSKLLTLIFDVSVTIVLNSDDRSGSEQVRSSSLCPISKLPMVIPNTSPDFFFFSLDKN